MKPKFRQLNLTGEQNDVHNAQNDLVGFGDIQKALKKFYKDNKDVNPRQLHYLIESESIDAHLDCLMGQYFQDDVKSEDINIQK